MRLIISVSILFLLSLNLISQSTLKDIAFKEGEEIQYIISYEWGAIWVDAGNVTFSVVKEEISNQPCFHLIGVGKTTPKWDWLFKVRDRYESWVNVNTLLPYRFKRKTDEGGWEIYNEYFFNYNKKNVITLTQSTNSKFKRDTLNITNNTFDIMTIVYLTRNLDFSKYKVNSTIPITIILDNEISNIYIRYLGKEVYDSEKYGKFNCIKLGAYLIEGTIFKEGENMKIWVTDDKNRIPLMVETPILVGSIKARIAKVKGLKFPLSSKIKK